MSVAFVVLALFLARQTSPAPIKFEPPEGLPTFAVVGPSPAEAGRDRGNSDVLAAARR